MSEHLPYPESEHKARLLLGDPVAEAYEWIVRYAESISGDPSRANDDDYWYADEPVFSADDLINKGMANLKDDGSQGYWDTTLQGGSLLEGTRTDPVFWEKLAILKGIDIPHEKRNNFFTCAC